MGSSDQRNYEQVQRIRRKWLRAMIRRNVPYVFHKRPQDAFWVRGWSRSYSQAIEELKRLQAES